MSDQHPDLAHEQAHLDYALACLEAMQQRAHELIEIGDRAVRDENTADARVVRQRLGRRAADLERAGGPLCFGRIDTDDAERWYIGRRHVEDAETKPVVLDWRAPMAAGYYRATAIDPFGLTHRRRFSVADNQIEAMFDEDLTDPDNASASGIPDPLLAELDRSRSGQMSDIVATIAAEQDIIIRAPLERLLIVQGGPGTGKTAVGLHRAAFLLYEHRMEFIDTGVLVLGPNPLFLRYIADVLPSLGETSVRQTTLPGLLSAKHRVRGIDAPEVAEVKGRTVMAEILERAIRARIGAPKDGLEVRAGLAVVRFDQADLDQMINSVLDRNVPVNKGREVFRQMLLAESWRRHSARAGADPGQEPVFTAGVRASAEFKKAVDKMWPSVNPVAVVRSLFSSAPKRRAAAEDLLAPDEQALLARKGTKAADEPWTAADLALLDEAEARLNGVAMTYGHVIVDEAQDLSPMALRMIARRAPGGSMTVLGDLAQATVPGAAGSWEAAVSSLAPPDAEVQIAELTVGYRVPAAILDVANRLLPRAAPSVTPARSVRPGGEPPKAVTVSADRLVEAVTEEVAPRREAGLSVAVIACEQTIGELAVALDGAGITSDRVGGAGLPGHDAVALLDPLAAKGLEFDAVVVVEPADIAAMSAGLRHLYVAMTRPVRNLTLVATKPLPPGLGL